MLGLRFLQASLLVPLFRQAKVGTRALPIAFEEVSVVRHPRRKPRKRKASQRKRKLSPLEQEWKQYRAAQKVHSLSARFVSLMRRLRTTFDACRAALPRIFSCWRWMAASVIAPSLPLWSRVSTDQDGVAHALNGCGYDLRLI